MGDPADFGSRGGYTPINKELWDSLENMTKIVDRLLIQHGSSMSIEEIQVRRKELAKARRMLHKYKLW